MEQILQFGEGNFLRAFMEDYIENAKDKTSVAICQPRINTRVINALNNQNCKYDIIIRGKVKDGIVDSRKTINCVSRAIDFVSQYDQIEELFCSEDLRLVVSNTTEAGIVFNENGDTFPGKITKLLYKRYKLAKEPITFLPVELIENNGDKLKECILNYAKLWQLEETFKDYINNCSFCNTLVDRIVTGHDSNDFDSCSVCCEPYKSFVISCDDKAKASIPFRDDVTFTDDLDSYRTRKVRLLNGAHTMSVLGAYINSFDIVRDVVNDERFSSFISDGIDEIIASMNGNKSELKDYASSVLIRFNNPYIDHKLLDISLNSVAKFKTRVLPSIVDYAEKFGTAPVTLSKSLAYLIAFYNHKSNREYVVNDDKAVLDFFLNNPSVKDVLDNEKFWDMKLSIIPNLQNIVEDFYEQI